VIASLPGESTGFDDRTLRRAVTHAWHTFVEKCAHSRDRGSTSLPRRWTADLRPHARLPVAISINVSRRRLHRFTLVVRWYALGTARVCAIVLLTMCVVFTAERRELSHATRSAGISAAFSSRSAASHSTSISTTSSPLQAQHRNFFRRLATFKSMILGIT
jgi:hypothetical protein